MFDKIQTLSGYIHEYQKSLQEPEAYWSRIAETFFWRKKWDETLKWDFEKPEVKWFVNGKLNITENIFERRLFTSGFQPAIIWQPNDPDEKERILTYRELYEQTCQFANVLRAHGIKKGDRVAIYMPMVPEAVVAMLACARIGAIHSVVFAGFSAISLIDRINDCAAKIVLTSDGAYRGAKTIAVKAVVDEAVKSCPSVEKTIVLRRTGMDVHMQPGRDVWWDDAGKGVRGENQCEEMDSEDILFILYTSGSTGKPKGIVHTCGGYMVFTQFTFQNVFQYSAGDVFWCTADIGWVTGHSYIVYGPLLSGATTL